eukprot:scaffold9235_cov112-Isochrysis_galbana.AAC.1
MHLPYRPRRRPAVGARGLLALLRVPRRDQRRSRRERDCRQGEPPCAPGRRVRCGHGGGAVG